MATASPNVNTEVYNPFSALLAAAVFIKGKAGGAAGPHTDAALCDSIFHGAEQREPTPSKREAGQK